MATGFDGLDIEEALTLHDSDLDAVNSKDEPNRLRPQPLEDVRIDGDGLRAVLPPASLTLLRFQERS